MRTQIVAGFYDAQPFVPFVMHIAGGRSITIGHRDFFGSRPSGGIATVYRPDGALHVVDLLLVTDLEFPSTERLEQQPS
jgi:hypothetical protein